MGYSYKKLLRELIVFQYVYVVRENIVNVRNVEKSY